MPEKKTIERAREDEAEGKAPTTQAGEFVREEIEHFFEVYKDLDPGTFSRVAGWRGRSAAQQAVRQGNRHADHDNVHCTADTGQDASPRASFPRRSGETERNC